jgi:hypothetical protein
MPKSWKDIGMKSTDNKPQSNQEKTSSPLTDREKKTLRLIFLRRTFSYLGTGLVCSAIVGGLYGDRLHFIWALCAVGAILIAFGWLTYLKMTDSLPFFHKSAPKKVRTPYIWRSQKQQKRHKPAFMQSAEDFEDDLTPETTADMETLSQSRRYAILVISRMAAGLLLILISFIIPQ